MSLWHKCVLSQVVSQSTLIYKGDTRVVVRHLSFGTQVGGTDFVALMYTLLSLFLTGPMMLHQLLLPNSSLLGVSSRCGEHES
jgi:hypothetical protein